VMASVEGDSHPPVGSSDSDVHPDASLSAVTENAVHKADAEARCMLKSFYIQANTILCLDINKF